MKWFIIGIVLLLFGAGVFDVCYIGLQIPFKWSLLFTVGLIGLITGAIIWAIKAPEYYIEK